MEQIFELVAAFVMAKIQAMHEEENEQGEHLSDTPPAGADQPVSPRTDDAEHPDQSCFC